MLTIRRQLSMSDNTEFQQRFVLDLGEYIFQGEHHNLMQCMLQGEHATIMQYVLQGELEV